MNSDNAHSLHTFHLFIHSKWTQSQSLSFFVLHDKAGFWRNTEQLRWVWEGSWYTLRRLEYVTDRAKNESQETRLRTRVFRKAIVQPVEYRLLSLVAIDHEERRWLTSQSGAPSSGLHRQLPRSSSSVLPPIWHLHSLSIPRVSSFVKNYSKNPLCSILFFKFRRATNRER